jgi:hypothetical protein
MHKAVFCWAGFFALLFLLPACEIDEAFSAESRSAPAPEPVRYYPGVDEALWVYFERFEKEAAKRGVGLNLVYSGVTGVIENILEDGIAGQCNYSSHDANHVLIDLDYWERATDLGREFAVFHELGHCELLRGHREDYYTDGTCVSIMRSGSGDCRDNYTSLTRESYLDELFDLRFAGTLAGN